MMDPKPAKNGILAFVGGPFVALGSRMLPPASAAESLSPRRSVVVDVPEYGRVRITYQLNSYRHRRNHFWHWVAEYAELDQGEPHGPGCPF